MSAPPERPASAALFWARLIGLPLLVGCGVWLVFQIPLPLLDGWLPVRNVLAVPAAIAAAGKTLFDTLFYDRFSP